MNKDNNLLPRLIRIRDAFGYLGMDRHRFNKEVRPLLTEMRIGIQGIAFDRLDLDKWVDYYKQHNGHTSNKNLKLLEENEQLLPRKTNTSHVSIKRYSDADFAKIVEQTLSRGRKNTWHR